MEKKSGYLEVLNSYVLIILCISSMCLILLNILHIININKANVENFTLVQKTKIAYQKAISGTIINTQENYRKVISQELHDNINQLLASAKIYLSVGAPDDIKRGSINDVLGYIQKAIEGIGQLSRQLGLTNIKNRV